MKLNELGGIIRTFDRPMIALKRYMQAFGSLFSPTSHLSLVLNSIG